MFEAVKKAKRLGEAKNAVVDFSNQHGPIVLLLFKSKAGYELRARAQDHVEVIILAASEVSKLTEAGQKYLPVASLVMDCYSLKLRAASAFLKAMTANATSKAPDGRAIAFYQDGTHAVLDPKEQ